MEITKIIQDGIELDVNGRDIEVINTVLGVE